MAETVLNQPLSGEEIREIVIQKITRALAGDTRLSAHAAYPFFEGTVEVKLSLGVEQKADNQVDYQITAQAGEVSGMAGMPVGVKVEHAPVPPNQARIEAGLGVPVLTHDEKGRPVEKRIHFTPEQMRRAQGGQGGKP